MAKIMIRQIILTTLLVLSWGVADAAAPAEKGAYIGAGFGSTTLDDDDFFSDYGWTLDDSDSGFEGFVGYKFFKYLAVEVRYGDFGTFTVADPFWGGSVELDGSVVSVHAVGIIPFADSGWELFGQLGTGTVDFSLPGEFSESENAGSAGMGIRYSFTENLSMGLQLDAYAYEEEGDWGETYDIGVVQTAITIRFSF